MTTISRLFQGCTSLSNVRLNWSETNTKNFSDISYAFYNCENLISLADTGIESWVLPNVTEGSAVFYNCIQLQSANLERWNPTKIVNLPWLFYGCENLQEFSLDGWSVPSLLSLQQAFSDCTKLEVIDLSGWTEIDSLNSLYGTFSGCTNVKEVRIPNIKSGFKTMFFYFTFDECTSLELLDISGWILDGCNEKVANSNGLFDMTTVFWGNTYPDGPFTLLADNWEVTVDEILTNADQKLEVPWYDSRTNFRANVSINNWNLNNTAQDLSGLSEDGAYWKKGPNYRTKRLERIKWSNEHERNAEWTKQTGASIHHRSKYAKSNKHREHVQWLHQLNRSGFEWLDRNGKHSNHRNVYQRSGKILI